MQKMTPDLLGMAFTHPVIQAEVDSAGVITINGQEVTPVDGQAPAVTCISAAVWLVGTQYGDGVLAPMHVRVGQDSRWYVLKGDITGAILRGPNDTNFSPIDPLDAMAFASDDQWEALGADAHRTWTSAGAPAPVDIDPDEALAVSGPPSIPGAMGPGAVGATEPAGGGAAPAADPGPVYWLPPEQQAPLYPRVASAPQATSAPQVPDTRGYPTASSASSAYGSYGVMPAPRPAAPLAPPVPPASPAIPAASSAAPAPWPAPALRSPGAPAPMDPAPAERAELAEQAEAEPVGLAPDPVGSVPAPVEPVLEAAEAPEAVIAPDPLDGPPSVRPIPDTRPISVPRRWSPEPAAETPAPAEGQWTASPEPTAQRSPSPEPAPPHGSALHQDDSVNPARPDSQVQEPAQAAPAAEPFAPAPAASPRDWNQPMSGAGPSAPSYQYTSQALPSSGDGADDEAPGRTDGHRVRRRAILLGGGVIGTAGAVALLVKVMAPSESTAGSASTTPRPSGTIALPSHSAPSPLSSKAVWEAEIKPQTSPLALSDGVAILTPGSTLDVIDVNGAPVSSQSAPADAQALVLGSMGGSAAIWAVAPTGMSWYPLTGTSLGAPTSVTPPQGATVSWVGGNPLFTLPNSSAAGVDSQGVYTVTVPSGHTATAATDSHVLVVDGNAHYSRISRAGAVGEGTLVGDGGTGAAPAYICTVTASLVAVGWNDATGGTLGLFSADDGTRLASMSGLDVTTLPASVIGFPERSIHAVGQVIMTTGDQPSMTRAALAPATCDGAYYYGQTASEQWLYAQMSDPTTTQPIDVASPAIPWGGAGDYSFVVDSDAATWKVYALLH